MATLGITCAAIAACGAMVHAGADVMIEGESMTVLERTALVDRQSWPATSGGAQLWWHGDVQTNDRLVLGFNVEKAGRYRVSAALLKAPDYGAVSINVDDAGKGQPIDLFSDRVVVGGSEIEIGTFELTAGIHRLSMTATEMGDRDRGRMFGLDALRLRAAAGSDELSPPADSPREVAATDVAADAVFSARRFVRIYDPSAGEAQPWYINDHTFVRDEAGTWHLIGITHAEPADPLDEKSFAHATAPSLLGPWTKQSFALTADAERFGEEVLWAPHVMRHDGVYYLFYCAGDRDHAKFKLHVATSPDLKVWTRSDANPIVVDGFDARDPMVLRVGDHWVLYYTGNSSPAGGDHVVFAVVSKDLLHWSEKRTVFTAPRSGREGGPTESPFVVRRGDTYYLFCGAWEGYLGTYAFKSADPFHFDYADLVGRIDSHASEIVRDESGQWYASHAGWGQGGVQLARLTWHDGLDLRTTSLPPAEKDASP